MPHKKDNTEVFDEEAIQNIHKLSLLLRKIRSRLAAEGVDIERAKGERF